MVPPWSTLQGRIMLEKALVFAATVRDQKNSFFSCYKNLHSFLWAKQAGFLLVWILLVVQVAKKSASLEKSSYH